MKELQLLEVARRLEHFRLFMYERSSKVLTDNQTTRPLIERNRSYETHSAWLPRWLD